MNKKMKQEYCTPKIKVVSFLIEKGFAGSPAREEIDGTQLETVDQGTDLSNTTDLTRWV